ncbi:hypothetical protein KXV22_001522 [Aspergillus fumigatus]|nr:hypothetical protein KXX38_009411 [Aspergillus fumigatus]KAH1343703.1 hypothetical protein KXX14_005553 [Aspergillus fumigatus]KAH1390041.1 hypothetical protein KXX49_003117 [Aspergillus fumigatus]KAH1450722.1 hypothetical protein KXX58_004661 [Aspergillus fumigatus]KAH1515979.1 hypothetical protein KXX06_003287 [Aspergillus fumigatus]
MFYASSRTFKAYLSPTKIVESCKRYLLSTGFLDWTACLYQSDHHQSTPETEAYPIHEENVAPEHQPQDEMHPPTSAACPNPVDDGNVAPEYQLQNEMHPPTPVVYPEPVESIYFQTQLYAPLPTLKLMAFEEYGGVTTELGQRVIGIFFWADFGKRIGRGHVVLPPKLSAKSIPPEDWSLVQRHLDTARSLIPANERRYLMEKYGFDVENSLVLSLDWM